MTLDPKTTALVLIDLQNGIVGMPVKPRSGEAVVAAGKALAETFRGADALVVLVHVAFAADLADAPSANVDQPMRPSGDRPADWSELVPGLAQPSDLVVVKRNWGAFHGTELDLQLRRRGIKTIVLGGIATNFGVESTAREAWQHGYDVIIAEDATASVSAELHEMALRHIPAAPRARQAERRHRLRPWLRPPRCAAWAFGRAGSSPHRGSPIVKGGVACPAARAERGRRGCRCPSPNMR